MSGCLISLEGGEGAGKSTVLGAIRACIEAHGIRLLVTREPGGTALGEAVREPEARISDLEQWAAQGLQPDLTLLLDLPVSQGLARAGKRSRPDRIEQEECAFFERIRSGYRRRAQVEPARFRVIDASQDIDRVRADTCAAIEAFIASQRGAT